MDRLIVVAYIPYEEKRCLRSVAPRMNLRAAGRWASGEQRAHPAQRIDGWQIHAHVQKGHVARQNEQPLYCGDDCAFRFERAGGIPVL